MKLSTVMDEGGTMNNRSIPAVFASAMALALLFQPAHAVDTRSATDAEVELIRESMQEKLKDADSAKFRNIMVETGGAAGTKSFCGDVNSKNSYGAYAGFSAFYGMLVELNDGSKAAIVAAIDSEGDPLATVHCASIGIR